MNEIFKSIFINITFLFILYLIATSFYLMIATIRESFALRKFQKQQRFSNRLNHDYLIPVSIILATHNDGKKAVATVRSLLSLNYKLYEIVIVDDQSNDNTVSHLIESFHLKAVEKPIRRQLQTKDVLEVYQTQNEKVKITLLKKEHGGFADTFNVGINTADYPYFICMNTNFSLSGDSLQNLVLPILEDEHVVACTGIVRIGKMKEEKKGFRFMLPKGILRKAQVLEYNRFAFLSKQHNEDFGLPSFVLFQKKLIIYILGFDEDAVGENFELIRKIKEYSLVQQDDFVIKNAPNAVAFLSVPKSIFGFIRQRMNWNHGLSKNMLRYKKDVSFRCSVHEFYLPFIELIGIVAMIFTALLQLVDLSFIGLFIGSYILFCALLSLSIFLLKLWTEKTSLSFVDFINTFIASIVEVSVLKILSYMAKLLSFFGKDKP